MRRHHYLFTQLLLALLFLPFASNAADSSDGACIRQGILEAKAGNHAQAIATLSEGIKATPESDTNALSRLFSVRGGISSKFKDHQSALSDFNKAIELNPANCRFYIQRSGVLVALTNYNRALEDARKSVELCPDNATAHLMLGTLLFEQQHNIPEAIANFDRAIRLNPEDYIAFRQRGFAKLGNKEALSASADFDRALKLEPTDALSYLGRGSARMDRFPDAALADLDKAIQLDPTMPRAYAGRALLKRMLKDPEGAAEDLKKGQALDANDYLVLTGLAQLKRDNHDYKGALVNINQAIAAMPSNADLYSDRANLEEKLGDKANAIADREKALKLNPKSGRILAERGETKRKSDPDGAIKDFSDAIRTDPKNEKFYIDRGFAYVSKGETENAIEDYTRAIQINPQSPYAFLGRAMVYGKLNQFRSAMTDVDTAVRLAPTNSKALLLSAALHEHLNDHVVAEEALNKAVHSQPLVWETYYGRGSFLFHRERFTEAIADFSKAMELSPTNSVVYTARAWAWYKSGQVRKAFVDLDKGEKLSADDSKISATRAHLLLNEDKPLEALHEAARMLNHNPTNAQVYVLVGRVYLHMLNFDAAITNFNKALELEPENSSARIERGCVRSYLGTAEDLRTARDDFISGCHRPAAEERELDFCHFRLWMVRAQLNERELGDKELAEYLASHQEDQTSWFLKILKFCSGSLSEKDLLAAAHDHNPRKTKEQLCEACFYAGSKHMINGDTKTAKKFFQDCLHTHVTHFTEYQGAQAALKRLKTEFDK